jgi:hypothetical protein
VVFGTRNPFGYGTIVTGENFVDRDEETERLLKTIRLGESAIVRAPNGIGKSSLLAELARGNAKEFIFVPIDLTGVTNEGALLDVLTRESMRAAYGNVERFPPEAWELLMNPKLRRAVVEGVKLGHMKKFGTRSIAITGPKGLTREEAPRAAERRIEIRMCPQCGRPLKWVEKYSRHYCYSCKKYAPIRRTVKLPFGTSGGSLQDEMRCPRCRGSLKFVHMYSEYYCEKCRRYPSLEARRTFVEKPTMADFVEGLDLPEKIANQRATRVVVMFDEFQEIYTIENPLILETMRERFDMHGNVSYIFAGSSAPILQSIFVEKNAPFANFSEWIELGPIPDAVLERHLMDEFRAAKGKLTKDCAEVIVGVCRGYPEYAQKIAHELYHLSASPNLKQTEEAVSAVVRHRSPVYTVLWESIRSPLHRKYLLAAAHEPRSPHGEDFVRRHGLKSRSHVQRIEKQLEAKGVINEAEIVDPMFVLWLRSTSQP